MKKQTLDFKNQFFILTIQCSAKLNAICVRFKECLNDGTDVIGYDPIDFTLLGINSYEFSPNDNSITIETNDKIIKLKSEQTFNATGTWQPSDIYDFITGQL